MFNCYAKVVKIIPKTYSKSISFINVVIEIHDTPSSIYSRSPAPLVLPIILY